MIFITGDTHGQFERFSSKNFMQGRELVKSDYVIIAGDFGGIWDTNQSTEQEAYWLDWLNDKPWTTLFVDGNHENFDRLDNLPIEEEFGEEVGIVRPSILHLKRGRIYNIQGRKFFTFGGGFSIDKARRRESISWWSRELPNYEEYHKGLDAAISNDKSVDYIITHTCSRSDFNLMALQFHMEHKVSREEEQLREYFNQIQDSVEYKKWFCGHFHVETLINKTQFLYRSIQKIE